MPSFRCVTASFTRSPSHVFPVSTPPALSLPSPHLHVSSLHSPRLHVAFSPLTSLSLPPPPLLSLVSPQLPPLASASLVSLPPTDLSPTPAPPSAPGPRHFPRRPLPPQLRHPLHDAACRHIRCHVTSRIATVGDGAAAQLCAASPTAVLPPLPPSYSPLSSSFRRHQIRHALPQSTVRSAVHG